MKIYHDEEAITLLVNGKKFTRYIDAYTEDLGEFKCPCCKSEMEYHEGSHCLGQNCFVKSFMISCSRCNLNFYGYEENNLGFKNKNDFILFVKDRLNEI
jgi:C4-type Zn-finger protein